MASLLTGSPATNTSISATQLPPWLGQYWSQVLGQAIPVAAQPYQPAPMPRIAPFTPDQLRAMEITRAGGEASAGLFPEAISTAQRGAAAFDPGALAQFMNPYTENVVSEVGRRGMENLMNVKLPGVSSGFISAGAPGSRRALEAQGKTISDTLRDIAGVQGGLLAQGYTGALGQYNTEQQRALEASGILAGLGGQGVGGLAQIGGAEQALGQKSLEAAYQDFIAQRQYPQQQLQWLAGLPAGMPTTSTKTETSTQMPATTSGLSQIGGIADIIAGLGGLLGYRRGGPVRRYANGGMARPMMRQPMPMGRMPMMRASMTRAPVAMPRVMPRRTPMLVNPGALAMMRG